MKRNYRIVTDNYVSDPRIERRIIEYNRERLLLIITLVGCVLVLLAVMW